MKNLTPWVLGAVILAATGGAYLWQQQRPLPAALPAVVESPPVVPAQSPAIVAVPPPILHPIEAEPPARPLPTLGESDTVLAKLLAGLLGAQPWQKLFISESIIRRIVATIDNLPRRDAPVKVWPLRPVSGWLATTGSPEAPVLAVENSRRYAAHAAVLQAVDVTAVVALYREFYPLFQQAYLELGYPDGYFNDRLIQAIDDLLATPEPAAPLRLVQERVRYRFADADLEGRSAGQKIMLRIGTAHARIAKKKLAELRRAVASAGAPVTRPDNEKRRPAT